MSTHGRLDEMAGQIGRIGMAAGALTFLVLLALRLYSPTTGNSLLMDVLQFFIIGVAFAVWAVVIGGIGTASESFPPSRGAGIAIGAVSVLLAAACMVIVLLVIG